MNVNRKLLWPLVALALCAPACAEQRKDQAGGAASAEAQAEPFKSLTIDELSAKMEQAKEGKLALAIYDNNNKDVFTNGHIPGAKWVAFDDVKATDLPADKETTLVFYCANEH